MPPKKPKTAAASAEATEKKPVRKAAKKPAKKKPVSRAKAAEKATEKPARKPASKTTRTTARTTTRTSAAAKPVVRKPAAKASKTATKTSKTAAKSGKAPVKKPKKPVVEAPAAQTDPNEARRDKTREIAKWVAVAALDKKAERVEIIDLSDKVDYADFLVLMTGRSDRQNQAIAQGIIQALTAREIELRGQQGMSEGNWVLLDFNDVVAHVFLEESRQLYDLEGMWMGANRVTYEGTSLPSLPPPAPTPK